MKKYILIISIISLYFVACDESFNPFTEFKQDYGVACILRSDTTLQLLSLTKSYPQNSASGSSPIYLFEENADVRIWYQDSVYRLKDTSIYSPETQDTFKYYFSRKFKIDYLKDVELEILLNNGKRLKAYSKTPDAILFKTTSEVLIPPVNKSVVQLYWSSQSQEYYYLPRLRIKCERIINGSKEVFFKELPTRYETINGELKPIFPKPSKNPSIAFQMEAINKFLMDYSNSLTVPSDVTIHQILDFQVITFDAEVSRYISVSNSSSNNLSIRFDEGDYSNISGGLGIFGSQVNTKYTKLRFLENYIRGYNFKFLYDL
ncbi:MAG TPA: DUF4249 family protein [Ignavibacteriaceae bacterium]